MGVFCFSRHIRRLNISPDFASSILSSISCKNFFPLWPPSFPCLCTKPTGDGPADHCLHFWDSLNFTTQVEPWGPCPCIAVPSAFHAIPHATWLLWRCTISKGASWTALHKRSLSLSTPQLPGQNGVLSGYYHALTYCILIFHYVSFPLLGWDSHKRWASLPPSLSLPFLFCGAVSEMLPRAHRIGSVLNKYLQMRFTRILNLLMFKSAREWEIQVLKLGW